MPNEDKFFLGRKVDPATAKATDQIHFYDPADLTTHAVVTGMTGSGKTGLCVGLLEEAALQNIPAVIIDPKGDLTNLMLHFPNLLPSDFEPWMDSDAARKSGKTTATMAEETAANWKTGLAGWGIDGARIAKLAEKVDFTIYTPGSDSGLAVSIMASLKAPSISWDGNREILMEKISSTVSALLGLVGMTDLDPVRSREHILLSNIFQAAWSQGKDLDLSELILQTQNPPFDKLGVFPLDKFFPEKDRTDLAMLLNNFLASPAFQSWMTGEPLDIGNMLYTPAGKPRHCIFYIAHLSDTERMFFVTLLYSSIEAWMRTQTGTSGLRALVYFDEIMGYLPPNGNPSSKMVILRMLKQARAFGVGLLLATQNPVDVDYKALSNAGTWFVGKLQTDQDKQRLLDGLENVAGGVNRNDYDKIISALGKRVFLVHNVHDAGPVLMNTRWTMNYLAGPLTRVQIPKLNEMAGVGKPAPSQTAAASAPQGGAAVYTSTPRSQETAQPAAAATQSQVSSGYSQTKPQPPRGVSEVFFPNNQTISEASWGTGKAVPADPSKVTLVYKPVLFGQVQIRYLDRRYALDQNIRRMVMVTDPDPRGMVQWDDFRKEGIDPKSYIGAQPAGGAKFAGIDTPLADPKLVASMQKDFLDWVFQTGELRIMANLSLKQFASPSANRDQFVKQCEQAAETAKQAEIGKIKTAMKTKLTTLQQKISKEETELNADKADLNARTMEEVGAGLNTVLGLFGGKKHSLNTNLSKRRQTANARADVEESEKALVLMKQQLADMTEDQNKQIADIEEKWKKVAEDITEIPVLPSKTNIFLDVFGIGWMPVYEYDAGGEKFQLPAWK
jgi:hypothetical protein